MDVHRLHANATPFYIRGLEHLWISLSAGVLEPGPPWILRHDYIQWHTCTEFPHVHNEMLPTDFERFWVYDSCNCKLYSWVKSLPQTYKPPAEPSSRVLVSIVITCFRKIWPIGWLILLLHHCQTHPLILENLFSLGHVTFRCLIRGMLLFSCWVVSDSLQPHGLQHATRPCPPLSPRVCSNTCPLSQWYHPTISSSVAPFSFCLQSFPASGSFPVSWLFTSGGQSVGASASVSVLPMNI